MGDLVIARNLVKGYMSGDQRLEILVDLSLDVAEGERVAITGVSGSGKSTLLHLLGGMDRADSGRIEISRTEISKLSRDQLSSFRNNSVGFVFQFHHLLPEFSALENVMMPLLIRGETADRAKTAGLQGLQEVGLADRSQHRPGALSGGELQRIAIARALVGKPKLLLADEPTGDLDPQSADAIGQLIRSLHSIHALTSITVTHNEKLAQTCSCVYRLEFGKLLRIM